MTRQHHFPVFILILITLLMGSSAFAVDVNVDDSDMFRRYNPDGEKYEFVRDYLTSLKYLKINAQRKHSLAYIAKITRDEITRTAIDRDNLIRDNVNLRVGRNYMKKYRLKSQNKLIQKAADQFIVACDELIALNNQQRALLEKLYSAQKSDNLESFDKESYFQSQKDIAYQKKAVSSEIIKISILVNKILVSTAKTDIYGDFSSLGITQEQRYKLIYKLDDFSGEKYEGELRDGQTFIEASVSTLREVLEDYSWNTIDG